MMDFQIRKQRREEMVREVGQDRLAKALWESASDAARTKESRLGMEEASGE